MPAKGLNTTRILKFVRKMQEYIDKNSRRSIKEAKELKVSRHSIGIPDIYDAEKPSYVCKNSRWLPVPRKALVY